nr:class I SAM-dependent methyltransferase [Woeseiaceae bacterium]
MSAHENEYHDNMVAMLELIWGEGYMAPGGRGNVARLLEGIDTQGKRILDVGCGVGGPAFDMIETHGASVVGIDLEAPLV